MEIIKKLSLPSQNVIRKKPSNQKNGDQYLFSNEFKRKLPNFSAVLKKNSFIPPCGRLFNGFTLNLSQFNTGINRRALFRSYLKSFLFLMKVRKITKFKNILYLTNSNSHNFFHWSLDILQKLEFIDQFRKELINSKLKIIIPCNHIDSYVKKSLKAFNLDVYFQKQNEIILSDRSILLPDIAPTGNYRKEIIDKLSQRMRYYWHDKNSNKKYKNKIYISRKNSITRKLVNEDEIIPILKRNGFNILDFDDLNFEKQLKYILNSDVLLSVHGAGLTHMLWMKPGSKVLEIRAKNNINDNCYFSLASDLNHNYYYFIADKNDPKKSYHQSDLLINSNNFELELKKYL
jgi:capsular polysaccharide biosynthesis protein